MVSGALSIRKPRNPRIPGLLYLKESEKSALGELRSATGGFQTVLLLAKNEKPVGIPYFFGCPNSG